jgi:hypothetical protein
VVRTRRTSSPTTANLIATTPVNAVDGSPPFVSSRHGPQADDSLKYGGVLATGHYSSEWASRLASRREAGPCRPELSGSTKRDR